MVDNIIIVYLYGTVTTRRKQAESRGSGFLTRQQHPASFLTRGAGYFLTSVERQVQGEFGDRTPEPVIVLIK